MFPRTPKRHFIHCSALVFPFSLQLSSLSPRFTPITCTSFFLFQLPAAQLFLTYLMLEAHRKFLRHCFPRFFLAIYCQYCSRLCPYFLVYFFPFSVLFSLLSASFHTYYLHKFPFILFQVPAAHTVPDFIRIFSVSQHLLLFSLLLSLLFSSLNFTIIQQRATLLVALS